MFDCLILQKFLVFKLFKCRCWTRFLSSVLPLESQAGVQHLSFYCWMSQCTEHLESISLPCTPSECWLSNSCVVDSTVGWQTYMKWVSKVDSICVCVYLWIIFIYYVILCYIVIFYVCIFYIYIIHLFKCLSFIYIQTSIIYIYIYDGGGRGHRIHQPFTLPSFRCFLHICGVHRQPEPPPRGRRGILTRKCHWVVHGDTANLVHDLSWNDDMEIMESKNRLKSMAYKWGSNEPDLWKLSKKFHWPWCGENFWRWVNHWVDLTLFPLHHPPKGFLLSFFIMLTEMDQRSIDVSQPRYYELISGQIMILNKS